MEEETNIEANRPVDLSPSDIKETGSPKTPERCAICLASPENKAVTDSCLHAFCFSCLKEWSKVKAECPLCKNSFRYIIYNVRANDDYDRFEVSQTRPIHRVPDFEYLHRYEHWMRETNQVVDHWMSSRIHQWRERIQVDQENSRAAIVAATNVELIRRRRIYYREGTQVTHVNNNKRVRDISSTFFNENPAQIHHLVPWLKRELIVLFGANNMMLVNRVCDLILSAVATLGITSTDFYNEIKPYFLERTDHFLKEFISFASSPHDIASYDNNAQYKRRDSNRRSSDSWSGDERSRPGMRYVPYQIRSRGLPQPPPLAHVRNHISLERRKTYNKKFSRNKQENRETTIDRDDVVVIMSSPESKSMKSSDGDDSDTVEFVKYIKPPHLRTPDAVIDLSSSPSDGDVPGPSNQIQPPGGVRGSYDESSSESDISVAVKSVVVPVNKSSIRPHHDVSTSDEKTSDKPFKWPNNHNNISRKPSSSSSDKNNSPEKLSDNAPRRKKFHKVYERKRSSQSQLSRVFKEQSREARYLSDTSSDDWDTPYFAMKYRKHFTKHKSKRNKYETDE